MASKKKIDKIFVRKFVAVFSVDDFQRLMLQKDLAAVPHAQINQQSSNF
jgi:hypothetical protein